MDDTYGYTNDPAQLAAAEAWRMAAIADGWAAQPTYEGHEPIESACTLVRDGFQAHTITRTKKAGAKWPFQAKVSVWGPDGLAVRAPTIYDWGKLLAGTQHCNYCHADGVETQRVSFAGRSCAACLREQQARLERPGWDD